MYKAAYIVNNGIVLDRIEEKDGRYAFVFQDGEKLQDVFKEMNTDYKHKEYVNNLFALRRLLNNRKNNE